MQEQVGSEEVEADLYFQLASLDRKRILLELSKEDIHLNEIAKRLDLTATEALRQLHRMTEALLLEKLPDGKYRLTPYAKLVLDTSSPLDFISQHRTFFLEHNAFLLPLEFRARLGELSGANFVTTTVETMNYVVEMFRGAQKKIDASVMGVEYLLDIARERLEEGLSVRWLLDESFVPKAKVMLRSAKKLPEMRHTQRIIGQVNVTDKAAGLSIRRNDGNISYHSFVGGDPKFVKWAAELFTHEWEKAKPWYP
ncbi:MAG TPA: transcriptional regulator FilR1 domain-containing protein [Nitrososphaerales archaeon]|nr:transcriptional regulator FilR1 domain-containing protein [Nitrososphaerales archaeon]